MLSYNVLQVRLVIICIIVILYFITKWYIFFFLIIQFMDFWLSFMAVIGTFVYLSTADEAVKRTIHIVVAILTALLALTQATRYVTCLTEWLC